MINELDDVNNHTYVSFDMGTMVINIDSTGSGTQNFKTL